MTKDRSRPGARTVKAFLEEPRAQVRPAYLPAGLDGEKVGPRRLPGRWHSVTDLLALGPRTRFAGDYQRVGRRPSRRIDGRRQPRLLELAGAVELFHALSGEPSPRSPCWTPRDPSGASASIGHRWLRRLYWNTTASPIPAAPLKDAVPTPSLPEPSLAGRAIGRRSGSRSTKAGCMSILPTMPGKPLTSGPTAGDGDYDSGSFPARPTMEALPVPVRGGSLELLRPFVNVAGDEPWHLFVGSDRGLPTERPVPGPVLHGEQGSAKSTTTRIVRQLVTRAAQPFGLSPREEQDLLIAARNNWVVAFDTSAT